MELAYQKLVEHYPEARLLRYNKNEVNKWRRPPYWHCRSAELVDEAGRVIVSRESHNLAVFSYSPAIDTTISLDELQQHLFSDPGRPDAICFHFRNQYRHWKAEWGFSIPHSVRQELSDSVRYHVRIDSEFDHDRELIQSDYHHQGQADDTYLFVGHFDHPSQVNDGLAGCIAAYEIIRRLRGRETRFSYRAFASVEIVGSVYYLDALGEEAAHIRESLFLGFSGIDSPFVYQQSYRRISLYDRIVSFLLSFHGEGQAPVYGHRQLIGNDENVFDSVGYEILGHPDALALPRATPIPTPGHHCRKTRKKSSTSAAGGRGHENSPPPANYVGLPSLANPDLNLYLSPDTVSGVDASASRDMGQYQCDLPAHEAEYLEKNTQLLNQFMQNMVRLSDGRHTILDLAEISRMPFSFTLKYASLMKDRGLVSFSETPV